LVKTKPEPETTFVKKNLALQMRADRAGGGRKQKGLGKVGWGGASKEGLGK